jgi:hypothetical protein
MARYEERRLRDTQQRTARRQTGHLAAATIVRVVDLADGLVALVNAERKHAAFAVARAVIETASVPAYVLKNVVSHLVKGRGERVDEVMRRLAIGVDRGVEHEGAIDPIPVSSLIKALCSELDARADPRAGESAGTTMRRLYSSVTDRTHPNHGAVHLSSTLDEHGMDWDRLGDGPPKPCTPSTVPHTSRCGLVAVPSKR